LVPEIIKFFVNHVQKFKCQAKIMSYAKVDCSQFKSRCVKVKKLIMNTLYFEGAQYCSVPAI